MQDQIKLIGRVLIAFVCVTMIVLLAGCAGNEKDYPKQDMVSILPNPDYLTVVNVITPKEGEQDKTVNLLKEGISKDIRSVPGFISATIHKSLDNNYVTVYAQWTNQEALSNAVKYIQDGNAPSMMEVFTNASPDFHPYEVISVITKQ